MAKSKRFTPQQVEKFSEKKLDKLRRSASWRLPTKFLTPEQQTTRKGILAKKKQDAYLNEEIVPESGLTRKRLQDMLAYESQLNYGDTERQLETQRNQLVSNRDRDSQWYDAYRKNVAGMQEALTKQNEAANSASLGTISTAREGSDAQDAKVAEDLRAQQEKLNLGGPSQAAAYQGVATQAANSRDTVLRSMAMAAAERARGGEALLGSAARGADMQKADALGRYAASDLELGQKQRDLAKNKAAFLQKAYEKAISDAQDAVLERKVFEATLDKNKSAEELQRDRLNWQKAYQQAQLGIMQQNANTSRINATRPRSSGGGGSSSSKKTRATSSQIQDVSNRMDRLFTTTSKRKARGMSHGENRQKLIKNGGYSNLEIDVINDMVYRGKVSKTNRRRLKAQGFKMSDFPRLK